MNSVVAATPGLPSMSADDVMKVRRLESLAQGLEQVPIKTEHCFHAGLYSRTVRIPAGVMITGALIRIPTLIILSGHATAFIGSESLDLFGYHVLPGEAGRKQAFIAHADTELTMIFATQATTVEQAEAEFTDETDLLMSRKQIGDTIEITGE